MGGPLGKIGHYGPNGKSMSDRIEAEGEWMGHIGENMAYGSKDPKASMVQLLVDDGTPSRGHRKNLMSPNFKVVGIAMGTHSRYKYMTCQDFATGFDKKGSKPKNSSYMPKAEFFENSKVRIKPKSNNNSSNNSPKSNNNHSSNNWPKSNNSHSSNNWGNMNDFFNDFKKKHGNNNVKTVSWSSSGSKPKKTTSRHKISFSSFGNWPKSENWSHSSSSS